jgi:septin family protein
MMHVIDVVLNSFSDLFRSRRYSPLEKLFSVVLFTAGLSIREMKEGTKRFYNNVNSKKLKSVENSERSSADLRSRKDRKEGNTNLTIPLKSAEELITAIAAVHNVVRAKGEEAITNLKVPDSFCMRKLMFVEQLEPLHYLLGLVRVSGNR